MILHCCINLCAVLFASPNFIQAGYITSPIAAPGLQDRATDRLDINTATLEELVQLPGIGPVLASRIIEHRRKHGRFRRPQDIIIVRGMSAGRFRPIAHLIRTS